MTLENTTHYPIDGPTAAAQWESVYPPGFGFVRLGEPRRILCVSMFHQLHCVEKFRLALHDPDDPVATIPHLQHCMNYIRQMVLCRADLRLESVRSPVGSKKAVSDITHTCRDWSTVYEAAEDNFAAYMKHVDSYIP